MDDKDFYARLVFLNESFTLSETGDLEKISLPTATFKENTKMLSSKFRKALIFGVLLWLYKNAVID